MDNADEQPYFSKLGIGQFSSDNQPADAYEYGTNICLPSYCRQPHDLLADTYTHTTPLPSLITEGSTVPSHETQYTRIVDFDMTLDPGLCHSQWNGTNASLISVSVPKLPNQHQILHRWSRDLEPSLVPVSITQSLPSLTYPNARHYDARMLHISDGAGETRTSSPGGSTHSDSVSIALADYGFPFNTRTDPQSVIALTHDDVSAIQSAAHPSSELICGSDHQPRAFECRWLSNGIPCEMAATADRRSVIEHLQDIHRIKPGEEKVRQACLWEGCRKTLNKESLARHILTVHLKEKVHCPECGLLFAREDSLKRHLKGGQHKGLLPTKMQRDS